MLHYAAPMHGLSIRFERETKRLKRGTHEGKKKRKKIGNADEIHCGFFIWRGIIFYPPFHPE